MLIIASSSDSFFQFFGTVLILSPEVIHKIIDALIPLGAPFSVDLAVAAGPVAAAAVAVGVAAASPAGFAVVSQTDEVLSGVPACVFLFVSPAFPADASGPRASVDIAPVSHVAVSAVAVADAVDSFRRPIFSAFPNACCASNSSNSFEAGRTEFFHIPNGAHASRGRDNSLST